MSVDGLTVAVIGGGVAGLAVARALALKGAAVTVHEQAPEISEVGAGLQISPNGLRVIDALGLGEALRAVSLRGEAIVLRDYRRGAEVLRMPLGDRDYLLVHRARLIECLEAGARDAGVAIALGAEAAPASLKDADIVIGADGLHSATRTEINGPAEPFFTNQVAWRAVIPDDGGGDAPVSEVFMAPGRHLVSYPLAGGLRNIVAVEERGLWTEEGWHREDDPAMLRLAFRDFCPRVQGWLERVGQVHIWGLFRHEVAQAWYRGNLAILGDAAHPTLPFLAQGANLAFEDAWVLADCLSRDPADVALPLYQSKRRARVTQVIDAATANARNFHLGNPLIRGAAHGVLRLAGRIAPAAPLRRFDWLYGYDATKPE